jgi:hypothetical protein
VLAKNFLWAEIGGDTVCRRRRVQGRPGTSKKDVVIDCDNGNWTMWMCHEPCFSLTFNVASRYVSVHSYLAVRGQPLTNWCAATHKKVYLRGSSTGRYNREGRVEGIDGTGFYR